MEGVAFEDIGESFALAGSDHRAEAGLLDGPDGVLAARAAAEVAADGQDRRAAHGRGVQRELRAPPGHGAPGSSGSGAPPGSYRLSAKSSGP